MADTTGREPGLDDVMLAMDVVDTVRHRHLLVERELDSRGRERRLIDRLRDIYAAQGIEVPDHVLAEGVAALEENRFAYEPPRPGFPVTLARLYVSRGRWGWPVLGVAGVVLALVVGYAVFVSGPEQRAAAAIPEDLAREHAAVVAAARTENASSRAQRLLDSGMAALSEGRRDDARETVTRLRALRRQLDQEYVLRIVSRPDERSGIWRIPDINPSARNYYLIIEAVTPAGEVLTLDVTSEEDGRSYKVNRWALRVDEQVYRTVAADKGDDGIIQNRRVGAKRRGHLDPEYTIATSGAAITKW